MRRAAAILDVASVLAFVVIGRDAHRHGETLAGIWSTAWPFLSGLAIGWAHAVRRQPRRTTGRDGVVVWLSTVTVGMVLRVVVGQGTAVAFVIVALCFLGATMLGGRAVLAAVASAVVPSRAPRGSSPGVAP